MALANCALIPWVIFKKGFILPHLPESFTGEVPFLQVKAFSTKEKKKIQQFLLFVVNYHQSVQHDAYLFSLFTPSRPVGSLEIEMK